MQGSGDCPNLNPQPLSFSVKYKELIPEEEVELNKSRLSEIKREMKLLKEQIKQFSEILQKEVGDEIDLKELLRCGHSSNWQNRAQIVMNLKLKLTSMRSKFLDPPHKMYYIGPFDPKKEFDLNLLPEKQENFYKKLLREKMIRILKEDKPIESLKKEIDELSLRQRTAKFRTKNLTSKIKVAKEKLHISKEKAESDLRVVEGLMAHQSLYKMMINRDTFQMDPTLKRHIKTDPLEPAKTPEWAIYKSMLNNIEKEKELFREATFSLTEKLDKVNKDLIETEKLNMENRLFMEKQKNVAESVKSTSSKDKQKRKDNEVGYIETNELNILIQENHVFREFLLSPILSMEEDFKLFMGTVNNLRQEFVNSVHCMKEVVHEEYN